jgi:hypothetical protein
MKTVQVISMKGFVVNYDSNCTNPHSDLMEDRKEGKRVLSLKSETN